MWPKSVTRVVVHAAFVATSVANSTTIQQHHQNSTSVFSSTTAGVHLGDFVAQGLGIISNSPSSSSTASTTSPAITTRPSAAVSTSAHNTTLSLASLTRSQAGNSSIGLDQCWNSWSSYWGELPNYGTNNPPMQQGSCLYTNAPTTMTQLIDLPDTLWSMTPVTTTYTRSDVIDNNGFATSTHIFVATLTGLESAVPTATTTSTFTQLFTQTSSCYTLVTPADTRSPSPSCALPTTRLSQCQASWETWLNRQVASKTQDGGASGLDGFPMTTAPSCTQATVGDALCTSVKDAYVSSSLNLTAFSRVLPSIYSKVEISMSGGYYRWANEEWKWPSTAYFGPSCTLGCGRCSIEGGTVELLYWPPATSSTGANATVYSGRPVTAEAFGTTLTSPTLYVSYHSLYATDACGKQVGPSIFDKIIAIPPESTLSSIWARPAGVSAFFDPRAARVVTSTASFNITDLHEPVPMSIYSSQPWCASWAQLHYPAFAANQTQCPKNDSYKPIIKIPVNLLQKLDPEWADCDEAFGGVYDPPIALQPATAIVVPTLDPGPGPGMTTSESGAQPTQASTPPPPTVRPTTSPPKASTPPKSSSPVAGGNHGPEDPTPTKAEPGSPPAAQQSDGGQEQDPQNTSNNAPQASPSAVDYPSSNDGLAAVISAIHSGNSGQPTRPTEQQPNDNAPQDLPSAVDHPSSNDGLAAVISALHSADSSPSARPNAPDDPALPKGQSSPDGQVSPDPLSPGDPISSANPGSPAEDPASGDQASSANQGATAGSGSSADQNSVSDPDDSDGSESRPDSIHSEVQPGLETTPLPRPQDPKELNALSILSSALHGGSGGSYDPNSRTQAGGGLNTIDPSQSEVIIGSQTFTRVSAPSGSLVLANAQTTLALAAGDRPLEIDGNTIYAGSSSNYVVASESPQVEGSPQGEVIIGSQTFTRMSAPSGSLVLANSQTTVALTAGDRPLEIDGHSIYAESSSDYVMVSGTSRTTISPAAPSQETPPVLFTTGRDGLPTPVQDGFVYTNAHMTITTDRSPDDPIISSLGLVAVKTTSQSGENEDGSQATAGSYASKTSSLSHASSRSTGSSTAGNNDESTASGENLPTTGLQDPTEGLTGSASGDASSSDGDTIRGTVLQTWALALMVLGWAIY